MSSETTPAQAAEAEAAAAAAGAATGGVGPAGPTEQKDVVRTFAERGEEALHRLAGIPGGAKALKAIGELGHRVDELGRKARGIDELEARVDRLERELAELRNR